MTVIRRWHVAGCLAACLALLTAARGGSVGAQNPAAVRQLALVPELGDLAGRRVTLANIRERHAGARLWLVRIQAAWCGTCLWHAEWTSELLDQRGDGLIVIDILVADEDNGPATQAALTSWQRRTGGRSEVLSGQPDVLATSFLPPSPLPRMLVVDPRSLSVFTTLASPSPGQVMEALDRAAAGGRVASRQSSMLVDGRFSQDQWALIQGMRMPDRPPADPTNRVADDAAAARFGEQLFFDNSLSPAARSCASCHDHELLFTNGKDVASEGAGPGFRNVPTILLAAHSRSLLWDGRADTLWGQAMIPFEDPNEMASSRLFVSHMVKRHYSDTYERIFGALPPLEDNRRFPSSGGPGSSDWERMTKSDRDAVTTVLVNVGKAIAAFERGLRVASTPLDRYASGELDALTTRQKDGLSAFMDAGCAQCHYGPRLSNDAFHNLRFPTGRADRQPDRGRAEGVSRIRMENTSAGPFSDAPHSRMSVMPAVSHFEGAFKTPGLRGVPFTMPYGHGGGFGGLRSVVEAHRSGGLPPGSRYAVGRAEPWAQGFDAALIPPVLDFLDILEARVVR
ncbi:MAG: cytochrome c peroxidase [Vicinamibacterales bacterium]